MHKRRKKRWTNNCVEKIKRRKKYQEKAREKICNVVPVVCVMEVAAHVVQPDAVDDGTKRREEHQQEKDDEDQDVHLPVNVRALEDGLAGILHDLGVERGVGGPSAQHGLLT